MSSQSKIRNKKLKIKENIKVAKDIYKMILSGDDFSDVLYGQFINIKVDNQYLKRPISISVINEKELTIYYQVVGKGTKWLKDQKEEVEVLYPLQKGYQTILLAGFRDQEYDFTEKQDNIKVIIDSEKENTITYLKKQKESYIFGCGPLGMLEALQEIGLDGQLLYEARMACGFGACMGCSIKTNKGPKRVCVEGPAFKMEDLNE